MNFIRSIQKCSQLHTISDVSCAVHCQRIAERAGSPILWQPLLPTLRATDCGSSSRWVLATLASSPSKRQWCFIGRQWQGWLQNQSRCAAVQARGIKCQSKLFYFFRNVVYNREDLHRLARGTVQKMYRIFLYFPQSKLKSFYQHEYQAKQKVNKCW